MDSQKVIVAKVAIDILCGEESVSELFVALTVAVLLQE